MKKIISTQVLVFCIVFSVAATHIRGGYIRAISQSQTSLSYTIELTLFGDTGSSLSPGGGEVILGDGTVGILEELADEPEIIYFSSEAAIYKFAVPHTYQAPGSYAISFRENNRNEGIINVENSIDMPFYIETAITIDPAFGTNSTPGLISPPAIFSKTGSTFFNSFACKDPDGDSLVYSLAVPLGREDSVINYKWPNNVVFYEQQTLTNKPTFSLHKLSGELEWDTPLLEGEFVIAYRVLEYRKVNGTPRKISETVIDLHIINRMEDSSPPIVDFDYEVLADGTIGFTSLFESSDYDTLEWSFYSDVPFILQETGSEQNQTGGTIRGSYSFQGLLSPEVGSDKPVLVVLSARSVVAGSPFKSVRSFAINPKGEAYVLTSIQGLNHLKINIYPNPATEFVQISLFNNNEVDELTIGLTNLAGQSILATTVPFRGNLATLDLASLAAGTYVVRAFIDGKMYTSKLVKN